MAVGKKEENQVCEETPEKGKIKIWTSLKHRSK